MKKIYVLTAILATSVSLYSNEVAATYLNPETSSMSTPSASDNPPTDPSMQMRDQNAMATRIMSSFKEALKANNAAGSCVVNAPSGYMLAQYSDMSEGYAKTSTAAPALDKRTLSAANKASTSTYFGTDSIKVSDRDIAMHNASMQSNNLTNLAGGMVLKNAKGEPMATIGITAVNSSGQDISAKVAADIAQQVQGGYPQAVPVGKK